ncbi:MAG: hypothetical protein R3F07_04205 [Opitutaceae bacterium]
MKKTILSVTAGVIALTITAGVYGGDQAASASTPPPAKSSGPAKAPPMDSEAAALAAYPMTVCVVSGDPLEGAGMEPYDYVYKTEGKPNQLVRLCCKDCLRDFKKDPEKYLAKIEAATANRVAEAKASESVHSGHNH